MRKIALRADEVSLACAVLVCSRPNLLPSRQKPGLASGVSETVIGVLLDRVGRVGSGDPLFAQVSIRIHTIALGRRRVAGPRARLPAGAGAWCAGGLRHYIAAAYGEPVTGGGSHRRGCSMVVLTLGRSGRMAAALAVRRRPIMGQCYTDTCTATDRWGCLAPVSSGAGTDHRMDRLPSRSSSSRLAGSA
jgi:hypothetical protein